MTIRWCAYCQEFLGEIAPFETFELTHGMCERCAVKGMNLSPHDLKHSREMLEIQKQLLAAGHGEGSPAEATRLIQMAVSAGVRPIDILMGFVTPLLRHIGKKWELGEATVAEEHRYTNFCEQILTQIEAQFTGTVKPEGVKILILNAPENYHTLGVRISAVWLNSHGISAKAIFPGLPPAEVPALLREYKPKYLGISVSLPSQIPGIILTLEAIRTAELPNSPEVILSGFAVKQGLVPAIPGATRIKDLGSILAKIA
jgi:methanogenic corrinoid protein MtbC1